MADDAPAPGVDLEGLEEIRPGAWRNADGQLVVNEELVRGLRFGHETSAAELEAGLLLVLPDLAALAAFGRHWTLAGGGEVAAEEQPGGVFVLRGPDGWLSGGTAGQRAVVTVDGTELALTWDDAPEDPDLDPGAVLATFEQLGGGAAVPLLDLVLHLLIEQRALFEGAPVPLQDVLALAGLLVRGTTVHRASDAPPEAPAGEPVGIPGLSRASALGAERLLGAVLAVARGEDPEADASACLSDPDAVAAMAEQLVGGELVGAEVLEATLDRLEPEGRAGQAGAAFLRSRLAEWQGDAARQEELLQVALGGGVPSAQVDAAWFAADRGDAREAVSLLRAARVPDDDPDLQLLARYTAAGDRLVGRNEPCWCGSGRKHKHCCLRLNGHDLASRAPWLHAKAVMFLQRPPQRTTLLRVATASAGVANPEDAPDRVIAAACDATVTELCLFEGGLFQRFVEQRGHLLPDDERELAQTWAGTRHRAWEVVDGGRALRHADGEERELDERSAAKVPSVGIVLAVVQPGPLALPGPALPVGAVVPPELLALLEGGEADAIAGLLGREFGWTAAPDLGSTPDPAPDALAAP